MPKGSYNNIKISGIVTAVPDNKRDTDYWYDKFGQKAVDRFTKMTGVVSVYQSHEKQTASDLAFVAARELLKKKNIDKDSIGALIFITQGPDYRLPATANVLQFRLGLSDNTICFDVNLGCSGYVNGINIVAALMESSNISRALLLVGDTSTKGVSKEDASVAMLFGDAGAATLLEKCETNDKINYWLKTDGNRFKAIIKPAGAYRNLNAPRERTLWTVDGNVRSEYDTYMNGTNVFTFTISDVPKLINNFLEWQNASTNDYDSLIFHQANTYIIKQVMKKIKATKEQTPISMDRYGNTSVTSIPLTLSDYYGYKESKSIKTLMSGFGVGLSWGVVDAVINTEDIFPIIETDEYFTDGGVKHD